MLETKKARLPFYSVILGLDPRTHATSDDGREGEF
jgi:hypothetical protein